MLSMPFFIINLTQYVELHNYHESICNITNVEYPDTFPDEQNSNFWIECDCGRRCTSLYPCVSLYTDINENNIIHTFALRNTHTECTFYEDNCQDGENPIATSRYLEQAKELSIQYQNQTTPCYIHNDDPENNNVYLIFENTLYGLIVSSVFFGLGILMILTGIIKSNKDKNITTKSETKNKETKLDDRSHTYYENNSFKA